MTSYPIPYVTTPTPNGEKTVDIYSRLLDERIIYLGTPVDDGVSNTVIAQLLHLESDNPDTPVSLYTNSPGGSQSATMAIYDCMQFIRPRVETTCVGQAVASAALLLAGSAPGHRSILHHGRDVLTAPAEVREDTERQLVLTPDAAVDYGVADRILTRREAPAR